LPPTPALTSCSSLVLGYHLRLLDTTRVRAKYDRGVFQQAPTVLRTREYGYLRKSQPRLRIFADTFASCLISTGSLEEGSSRVVVCYVASLRELLPVKETNQSHMKPEVRCGLCTSVTAFAKTKIMRELAILLLTGETSAVPSSVKLQIQSPDTSRHLQGKKKKATTSSPHTLQLGHWLHATLQDFQYVQSQGQHPAPKERSDPPQLL
ncbi:hypothetical protein KUCAC02_026526, partial [Chaenocephalus aceratus]